MYLLYLVPTRVLHVLSLSIVLFYIILSCNLYNIHHSPFENTHTAIIVLNFKAMRYNQPTMPAVTEPTTTTTTAAACVKQFHGVKHSRDGIYIYYIRSFCNNNSFFFFNYLSCYNCAIKTDVRLIILLYCT